ncbi:tannase/feruloyl esterase family alpha/beta hydrolase [Piscinibacter koreensis]|uniref:Tannase/feruloyl esterase family alpha/beta hydrolase n=1 Tax=Piscinibacter koreensis TaxID=2742824 RepID=A0A7Y6TV84_9BURK|nr:tannase/feruloyl esterase family alpha/beta hydrolase [Schlegelella koreensis]NUZ04819.1 tannase/feruloyl esterase family alpha/beta hydrolase [Schlegelella koreensis]
MNLRSIRPIALAAAVATGGAGAAHAADGYTIQSLNDQPTPEFVRDGNSVRIRVTAPSTALVLRSTVRLNGQNVTSLLVPDGSGALAGTVTGLRTGVNLFEVFAGKTSGPPLARYTVSTALTPQLGCASLVGIQIPPALLDEPADAVTITSAVPTAATATLPAHCIVRGTANPHVGANGTRFAIGFEVRLPTQWSGRLSFQGGGGNDGSIGAATGNSTGGLPTLARGFVVVSTDGGHTGGSAASFGFDEQARIDHAYNAYDKSAVIAKALTNLYYGKNPDRSYFQGCSGGGRQGMMFTQRFPEYFDGVIAGAPAMRVATGASISAAWESQVYRSIAPTNANGQPILSQAFSNADLTLVGNAILQQCDALDGLADGSVNNYQACNFDPGVLQCTGPKTASCLAPEQVTALRTGFGGPRNSAGQPLYVNWAYDPDISNAGWRSWKLGTSTTATPNSAFVSLIQDAMANEFFTPPDPAFNIFNFNFDTDPARMLAEDAIYGTWKDDQLAAYRAHGGKLLIYHGIADPIFSVVESIDYVNRVWARNGGQAEGSTFVRHFPVPGMVHCSGGPATDRFDSFAAIMDWVENGNAPDSLLATGAAFPGRSRPICAYPRQARYVGGDVNSASSFVCQ